MKENYVPCRCGNTQISLSSFGSTDYAQYYVHAFCERCFLKGASVRHHPNEYSYYWQGQLYEYTILAELWRRTVAGEAVVDQHEFDCEQARSRDRRERAEIEGWHAAHKHVFSRGSK